MELEMLDRAQIDIEWKEGEEKKRIKIGIKVSHHVEPSVSDRLAVWSGSFSSMRQQLVDIAVNRREELRSRNEIIGKCDEAGRRTSWDKCGVELPSKTIERSAAAFRFAKETGVCDDWSSCNRFRRTFTRNEI